MDLLEKNFRHRTAHRSKAQNRDLAHSRIASAARVGFLLGSGRHALVPPPCLGSPRSTTRPLSALPATVAVRHQLPRLFPRDELCRLSSAVTMREKPRMQMLHRARHIALPYHKADVDLRRPLRNHADIHLRVRHRIEHARRNPWLAVNILADQTDNRMLP